MVVTLTLYTKFTLGKDAQISKNRSFQAALPQRDPDNYEQLDDGFIASRS